MYDYLVYIGRFQPFHLGHQAVVRKALEQGKQLIILIGSANVPRSIRNPFTFEERKEFILDECSELETSRITCLPLEDIVYNDTLWVKRVQESVAAIATPGSSVGLIGHNKDSSSYYLSLFPKWGNVNVENVDGIDGTNIRGKYLLETNTYEHYVPFGIRTKMGLFKTTADYALLAEEAGFIREYHKQWSSAPYPPTFVTVDAVVIQAGHVLLIERKHMPGKGLWALPGGFIGQKETLIDACVRELREETRLKLPELVIRGSLKTSKTYDDPNRSERGRTITTAFRFDVKPDPRSGNVGLPKVKGSDDAKEAFWVPLSEVDPSKMYEDHYSILMDMVNQ